MCDQIKTISENNSATCDRSSISPSTIGPSCLRNSADRSKKGGITRNVSFPEDDSQIVTGILEPENPLKSGRFCLVVKIFTSISVPNKMGKIARNKL